MLLDNFVSASSMIDDEEHQVRLEEKRRRLLVKNPLEPLLKKIVKEFADDTDLSIKLRHLYKVAVPAALDGECAGSIPALRNQPSERAGAPRGRRAVA